MTRNAMSVWSTIDRQRWFILPDSLSAEPGSLTIRSLAGQTADVDPAWAASFEASEDQARRWAKNELGNTLSELKAGVDEKLGELRQQLADFNRTPVNDRSMVTPDAASAILAFFKALPRILGNSLSADEQRVKSAKNAMADLQQRLKEAGINLDDRFTNYPDRLADLREDFERERAAKKSAKNEPPPDKS
jgi:hypothetical protein